MEDFRLYLLKEMAQKANQSEIDAGIFNDIVRGNNAPTYLEARLLLSFYAQAIELQTLFRIYDENFGDEKLVEPLRLANNKVRDLTEGIEKILGSSMKG